MGWRAGVWLVVLLGVAGVPQAALAGGIYFPYLGARATGMGGSFVARADDATSLFHNPAGMLLVKDSELTATMHLNIADFEYTRRDGGVVFDPVSLESTLNPQPFLGFVTSRPEERWAVGLGTYAAWGGIPNWPDDGPQRYILDYFELIILHNTVAGAYELAEGLQVGAGGSLIYASLGQRKSIDARDLLGLDERITPGMDSPANEIVATIAAKDWAFGGHLGVLYQPTPWIRFGATYTLPTTLHFSGTISSDVSRVTLLSSLIGDAIDATVNVDQPLPQVVRVGVAVAPTTALSLSADALWQNWDVAETNVVQIQDQPLLEVILPGGTGELIIPRFWQNSWSVLLGAEYKLGGGHAVRAGYFYDQGAIPTSTVSVDDPDADKMALSGGVSVRVGQNLTVDLAGEYRKYDDVEVSDSAYDFAVNPEPNFIGGSTNGSYRSAILGFSAGIRYRFRTGGL